ncbi:MAG: sigma-E processing peptidase SpoIIGA [Peptococcaceae bacterium]|jgi:stage II sporulation protein GA (sporulation sigma-E factor processing peptidase)|nr:sigma-E processing peptidase SpoIIGA [Peptococcaceae bacterium]
MPGTESYLDIAIGINGLMDAFLLVVTGRLLRVSLKGRWIFMAVIIGEIPVILSFFDFPLLLNAAKFLVPVGMVWLAYQPRRGRSLLKALLGFWLVSAGLGGLVQALWGWAQFQEATPEVALRLSLHTVWLLPLAGGIWWGGQRVWQRWRQRSDFWQDRLYEVEIDFGKENQTVKTQAFIDTGNHLRDPVSGVPVLLLEEAAALSALPEEVIAFLREPWQDSDDPWPWLWKQNPSLMKKLVFVPFQAIGKKSWLLAVRPQQILIHAGLEPVRVRASVALVKQVLSSEGRYRALLHPELAGQREDEDTGV